MTRRNILFLTLYTFSLTGGIEKVCRNLIKTLNDFSNSGDDRLKLNFTAFSMYDREVDLRYTENKNFSFFKRNKISFGVQSIIKGLRCNTIILSHINLLPFAWIIRKIKPETKIIMLAHGIEVWDKLAAWKISFLNERHIKIWAVSQFTSAQLQKNNGIKTMQIEVLNNCLDPFFCIPNQFEKPAYLLKRYFLQSDQPILLSICRLSSAEQYKGYDQVISALKTLKNKNPDIRYLLVGKADEPELNRVKKLIIDSDLEKNVTITGFIPEAELTDHYLLADLFIMPSKREGFGIGFIEAAACGCYAIAGNSGGSSDAILNGISGKLINPESVSEIASTIQHAISPSTEKTAPLKIQQICLKNFSFKSYKLKIANLL